MQRKREADKKRMLAQIDQSNQSYHKKQAEIRKYQHQKEKRLLNKQFDNYRQ